MASNENIDKDTWRARRARTYTGHMLDILTMTVEAVEAIPEDAPAPYSPLTLEEVLRNVEELAGY